MRRRGRRRSAARPAGRSARRTSPPEACAQPSGTRRRVGLEPLRAGQLERTLELGDLLADPGSAALDRAPRRHPLELVLTRRAGLPGRQQRPYFEHLDQLVAPREPLSLLADRELDLVEEGVLLVAGPDLEPLDHALL